MLWTESGVSSSKGTMDGSEVEKLRDGSNFWASWQFCMKHKAEQTKQEIEWGHLERHYRYQEELVQRPGSRKEQGMGEELGLCVETGACKPQAKQPELSPGVRGVPDRFDERK